MSAYDDCENLPKVVRRVEGVGQTGQATTGVVGQTVQIPGLAAWESTAHDLERLLGEARNNEAAALELAEERDNTVLRAEIASLEDELVDLKATALVVEQAERAERNAMDRIAPLRAALNAIAKGDLTAPETLRVARAALKATL